MCFYARDHKDYQVHQVYMVNLEKREPTESPVLRESVV
jgi:hypothetical protein